MFQKLGHPALLEADQSYAVVSEESPDGDAIYAAPAVELDPALRLEGPVSERDVAPEMPPAAASGGLGPASFRFAIEPAGD